MRLCRMSLFFDTRKLEELGLTFLFQTVSLCVLLLQIRSVDEFITVVMFKSL